MYTIINRHLKFKHVQGLNESKTNLVHISKDTCKNLLDIFTLLRERLKTMSDKLDFERVTHNVLNIIREKKEALVRTKKLETMKTNAGYTLITSIVIIGIVGLSFITFLLIKNILY